MNLDKYVNEYSRNNKVLHDQILELFALILKYHKDLYYTDISDSI